MFTFTTSALDLTKAQNPAVFRVSGINVSAGATASVILLRDGGASGPIYAEIKVPASTSKEISYNKPMIFSNGVYVVPDANTSRGCLIAGQ